MRSLETEILKTWPTLVAAAALAIAIAAPVAVGGTVSTRTLLSLAVLRDRAVADSLAGVLNLDPAGIYFVRRDQIGPPTRLATRDAEVLPPIALSPSGDLVAYSVWREVSCDPAYSLRARFAVVADTAGDEGAVLPEVWSFAWAPSGDQLAVVYGHADRRTGHAPDSIGVIDVRTRQGTTYQLQARHVGWRDAETLLLRSQKVQQFDLGTQALKTTEHGRWNLSPDQKYSLFGEGNDDHPMIVTEASGADLSARVQSLLGGKGVATTIPPFWVEGNPCAHLLCVSTTSHELHLVDVAKGKIVRSIIGIGLAATPDRRAVVVCRDGRLVFEDL